MLWKPFTRGRRTKPEAVSDSETEWNRRKTSRKPNQDTTRGGDWSPAPRGPAGAVEHTARLSPGSEHNGAAELGTPEKRQYKLNQGELDCADAELCRRAGKPPPFSGHVPLRGPPRRGWLVQDRALARGKLDFTGRPVSTTGAGWGNTKVRPALATTTRRGRPRQESRLEARATPHPRGDLHPESARGDVPLPPPKRRGSRTRTGREETGD